MLRFARVICPDVRGDLLYVSSVVVMHVRDHLGACFAVARVHHDINCCYVIFLCHLCHVISSSSFVRMMQMTCPRVRLAMIYVFVCDRLHGRFIIALLSSLQSAMWP